jgi:hypothetical protein
MSPVVAVIAPGAMGAAVGKRLADNGLTVLTSLEGRSDETRARAKAAGMTAAKGKDIARADFILSILPPGDALSLAQRFVPALTASNAKPVYVDCNAINPKTVDRVAAAIAPSECPFVDASGAAAPRFAALRDYGLDIRVLDGEMSAASALKMSYAGITKGTQAIGAAMMLAATRAGSADALMAELQLSQKEMLAWLKRQLTMMPPKAYRWVAEMQEIAGFVGDDPAARELYEGAAEFYARFAEDFAVGKKDAAALAAFLSKTSA